MQVPIVLRSLDHVLYYMGHHSKIIALACQRVVLYVTSILEGILHEWVGGLESLGEVYLEI